MFNRREYKQNALSTLKNHWFLPCILAILTVFLTGLSAMAAIVSIGVFGILLIGMITTFMKMIEVSGVVDSDPSKKVTFNTFLQALEDHWLVSILGGLWYCLWVTLWSYLFVIPGIVKAYSYSMMFYILAENPKIGALKAMNISKILTQGHKADLFIMDLSFLGWSILSACFGGIGFIWLIPYKTMSKTHAYYDLKRMALSQNKLNPSDFEA